MSARITVRVSVQAPLEKVWEYFTQPEHITKWNHASPDWHAPHAKNDLRSGGTFLFRMESVDGSEGFDFKGTYTAVVPHERIEYAIEGGRHVSTTFRQDHDTTTVTTTFDAENENPLDMQRTGWQSILDNFKTHVLAS